jgi:glucose-6-phosphate isomerase
MNLSFDFSKMQDELAEITKFKTKAQEIYQTVQNQKTNGKLGFAKLPYQGESLKPILDLAQQIRNEFTNLVVIGIGGSDLGTRAVHRALNNQFYNQLSPEKRNGPRLYFLGDTTDPVAINELISLLNLKETAFVIVSKSGNTIEQMSTFIYVREELLKVLGQTETIQHLIIVTDAETGTLREIVKKDGYRSLSVPKDVGGRFSVFSSVSLFPLAVVGIDIQALLDGAAEMDIYDNKTDYSENQILKYALLQYIAYNSGRPICVFMPYTYSLREVGFWFRQLWAESLGKRQSLDGKIVNVGPTPIAAIGPTDQHSQVQLYMEGPTGKVFTFLTVKNPINNLTLPLAYPDLEGVAYLEGHNFNEILLAEQESTAYALYTAGRPSLHIQLDHLDAFSLGQLLYYFEIAVTYAGALFEIDTFNQPGVELGKQYMYGLLGRPGFEEWKINA